jgi:hypothetical protein
MLEDKVLSTNYTTEDVKIIFLKVILNISKEMFCWLFQNLMMRWEAYLQAQGHHFEHLLWLKVRIINATSNSAENFHTLLSLVGRKAHNFLATLPGLGSTISVGLTYITYTK